MKLSKRQRKKRGKSKGIKETKRESKKRKVGFREGAWIQVYAQQERKAYWVKIDKLENVRDEERAFS